MASAERPILDFDTIDGADDDAYITICRDIPGNHTGGPDCFCCPGTFRVEDSEAIDLYLTTTQYGN